MPPGPNAVEERMLKEQRAGKTGGPRSPSVRSQAASPDLRVKDGGARSRVANGILEDSRGSDSGSGRKGRESEDWERYDGGGRESPGFAGRTGSDGRKAQAPARERERAVAEARVWGENWRERKRGTV